MAGKPSGGKKRSAALKSAKAAVKAQYDGKDPDKDDFRVKSDMDPNSEE